MQRREQQRRTAGTGGGSSYLSNSVSGYSPVPRFEAPEVSAMSARVMASSTPVTARNPAFKGSGMKLGSKKTKQAELLDALGGDVLESTMSSSNVAAPEAAIVSQPPAVQKVSGRGSLPEVEPQRLFPSHFPRFRLNLIFFIWFSVHIIIKEQITLSLLRDGGVQSIELKGDMNLQVTDPAQAHLRITLASPSTDFGGSNLQFKQHPHVEKFGPGQSRVVALKDSSRAFPVGQSLAVLKWRYAGTDESNVPLSSEFLLLSANPPQIELYATFLSKLLAIAFK